MRPHDTGRRLILWATLLASGAQGQGVGGALPDWRPVGSPVVELELASPASGPVVRVEFDAAGERLFALTRSGRLFQSRDGQKWEPADASHVAAQTLLASEPRTPVWTHSLNPSRLYALGSAVFRSDDGGRSWVSVTGNARHNAIGDGFHDLAVSPADPDLIVAANEFGVWRSTDGGLSWSGLNDGLPNLPVRRILGTPAETRGLRIEVEGIGALEWAPGERRVWRPVRDPDFEQLVERRRWLSALLGTELTAAAFAGDYIYAGGADGRLWVSPDGGRSWRLPPALEAVGQVESIWVDKSNPQLALAALATTGPSRLLRTTNGGLFWDDLTADLPAGAAVYGVTADRASGSIYLATSAGVFYTRAALEVPGPPTSWRLVSAGLPQAPARDVRLDPEGNFLFAALDGYGVFVTIAPHRSWLWRVVDAADYIQRPVAPGSLLSVLGLLVERARVGQQPASVVAASATESHIQVPFELQGDRVVLALEAGIEQYAVGLPLQKASPAILVDRDGAPVAIDAESGALIDSMHPARGGARVQLLVTGLGRVHPPWPVGLPAPLEDPPVVAAPVRAFLGDLALEVTRATLAPGFTGLYLVEIQLPEIVNRGPAELHLESEGQRSNRVRVYLEP